MQGKLPTTLLLARLKPLSLPYREFSRPHQIMSFHTLSAASTMKPRVTLSCIPHATNAVFATDL